MITNLTPRPERARYDRGLQYGDDMARDFTAKGKALNLMFHGWPKDVDKAIDALQAFGFNGVVTNVPMENGFTGNGKNLERFRYITERLSERGMEYWIYDEDGYPSGQAGGMTLTDKKLAAKGMYLRRFEAYNEPLEFVYTIDSMSDFIVFAATYVLDLSDKCETAVRIETCRPIPFGKKSVTVSLRPAEVCYIYIVKTAFEGTHCVHNVSSRKGYINIMEPEAVEKFIESVYRPMAESCGDAMRRAVAVFTDEPSLMVKYARPYEVYNYALLPYSSNLFARYEQTYGEDLRPLLPLLYENRGQYAEVRVRFYELVASVIAENYAGRIGAYCRTNGTVLSGHYLGEECVMSNVIDYGNLLRVLLKSGYPGMDILKCLPDDFEFTGPKLLEMVARKKHCGGYMVEFCPFEAPQRFALRRKDNVIGCMNLLFMLGARVINSYMQPALKKYDAALSAFDRGLGQEEYLYINAYVSRLSGILNGREPVTDTFVYYPIEDVQAKFTPSSRNDYFRDKWLLMLDDSLRWLAKLVHFGWADAEDLENGLKARCIILPDCSFLSARSASALEKAAASGVRICRVGREPRIIGTDRTFSAEIVSPDMLSEMQPDCPIHAPEALIRPFTDGIYMIVNNTEAPLTATADEDVRVLFAADGTMSDIRKDSSFVVDAFRAAFAFMAENR